MRNVKEIGESLLHGVSVLYAGRQAPGPSV